MLKEKSTRFLFKLHDRIGEIDRSIVNVFDRQGHWLHRVSLGWVFVWFGLLKSFGHKTATSLLAHTVYWFPAEVVLPVLGWWEVAIGASLIYRPLVRLGLLLMSIRVIGTILAFFMHPHICFVHIPFVPTPEGQYLVKDLVILFAGMAIGGTVKHVR